MTEELRRPAVSLILQCPVCQKWTMHDCASATVDDDELDRQAREHGEQRDN